MASDITNEQKPHFKTDPNPGKWHGYVDYSDKLANDLGLYVDIYAIHAQQRVAFKAFLTQLSDSFDTGLDTTFFVGHPEPLRKMRTIDRQIQVGMDLIASNAAQAKQNLLDLSTLVKLIHPVMEDPKEGNTNSAERSYVKTGGDPIFKIKFKNLIVGPGGESAAGAAKINGLKGFIGNINYSFDLTSGFHNEPGDTQHLYPQLIQLAFSFFPFNEQALGWHRTDEGTQVKYKFGRDNFPYANAGEENMKPTTFSPKPPDDMSRVNRKQIDRSLGNN